MTRQATPHGGFVIRRVLSCLRLKWYYSAMRTYIVHKEATDYGRQVREFLRDFYRQSGHELIELNPESREGIMFCQTYDIVEYPTVIAVDNNGGLQQMWRGLPLPRISEVSYYATQN